MNKTLIFLGVLSIGYAHAQQGRVGINTEQPDATLHIVKKQISNDDKRAQGVIFPYITTAERDEFTGLVKGIMIYNTDLNCIDLYDGTKWSCITTVATAEQKPIPATVTLKSNSHFIASIYDDNYLPYTAPNTVATVGTHNPDNQNDTVINVPGVIPAGGIMVQIPITATGSGTLTASTLEATIQAIHTKGNGNTDAGSTNRKVLLTWPNTAFTSTDTSIAAFIKPADGQEIQIRRLDVNKGIGNDGKGIEIASFTYNANTAGTQQATFKLHAIAGVPDKKFGVQTNGKLEHQFIYIPIQGPDGRLWLNNNLGAEYANITSPYFNPTRQAGALDYTNTTTAAPALTNPTADQIKKDWRAYGYLYEWRRDSDGHEVINWTSTTDGTFANTNLHNYNYSSTNNPAPNTMGDPCPSGFHTPTKDELQQLINVVGEGNLWNETELKLPAAGMRMKDGRGVSPSGITVRGWTFDMYPGNIGDGGTSYEITRSYATFSGHYRTVGHIIRCIAD